LNLKAGQKFNRDSQFVLPSRFPPAITMPPKVPSCLNLGDRIQVDQDIATIRYIGSVDQTDGEWLGIEWDDPARGKHNGDKDGRNYFSCRY
jgi:hypothetical protein